MDDNKKEEIKIPEKLLPGSKPGSNKKAGPPPAPKKNDVDVDKIHASKYETVFFNTIKGHKLELRFYPDAELLEVILNDKYLYRTLLNV